MMAMLQLFIAPLVAAVLTLWAAWLALAAESDADLPRALGGEFSNESGAGTLSRNLHVAHLALLVLAGASAGGAVAWWARHPPRGSCASPWPSASCGCWVICSRGCSRPWRPSSPAPPGAGRPRPWPRSGRCFDWPPGRTAGPASRRPSPLPITPVPPSATCYSASSRSPTPRSPRSMTPRIDVVAVDSSADLEEVTATLRNSEHARLLVYDGHPDAVAGVIYAKDILAAGEEAETPWQTLIRPAAYVPEGKALDRQLRDFQRGPSHLAVVVDEFGGTAGLVTLEDILEQIVGEIQDERDTDEVAPIQIVADHQLRVEGGVALSELEGVLGHSFDREDVSTVGGLVLAEFGRVPRANETIDLDGYRLVVEQVVRRRVRRVSVYRPPVEAPLGGVERAIP